MGFREILFNPEGAARREALSPPSGLSAMVLIPALAAELTHMNLGCESTRLLRNCSSRFAVLEVLPCYPLKIANSCASGLQLRLGETILRDRNDHRQNSDDWSEKCLEESDHRLLSSWSRDGSHQ